MHVGELVLLWDGSIGVVIVARATATTAEDAVQVTQHRLAIGEDSKEGHRLYQYVPPQAV